MAALYHKSRFEIGFFDRQNPTRANNFEIWKSEFQLPASRAMLPGAPPISTIQVPWPKATNADSLETRKHKRPLSLPLVQ